VEHWDVYDRQGNRTGQTKTRADSWGRDEYHLGVSLWLVNTQAQVLIQKRAASKRLFPNVWCNICGSAIAGETSKAACVREAKEEVGVAVNEGCLAFLGRTINQNNMYDDYVIRNDFPIDRFTFPLDEVGELRWASLDEIGELFDRKLFLLDDLSDLDGLRQYICEHILL